MTRKIIRVMKLIAILLLVTCLTAAAKGYGQISLDEKNVPLQKVTKEIQRQSGYDFLYAYKLVKKAGIVTVSLQNVSLQKALDECLKDKGLEYEIINNTVVIKQKIALLPPLIMERVAAPPPIDVKGRVVNDAGEPLAGATIIVKGTDKKAIADKEGYYNLLLAAGNYTVEVSYVGYETITQKITVKEVEMLNSNFVLKLKRNSLNDTLVVIAYGTSNKKDLTGAVATISGKDIAELPPTINVEQALQGRAAGVVVTQESGQPGAATRVRIRGAASLLGSNQPLYVVDGIPVVIESNIPDNGLAFDTFLQGQGLNTPLANINVDDIETISVLKDASATAIYGSRAANGVVIITTKKGDGNPVYTLSSSLSWQKAQTESVLNAQQFREIWTEAINNSTSTSAFAQAIRNGSYFGNANTNWEKEVSPANPLTANTNFSISGGTDKIKYHTSLGIQNQDGTFKNAFFNRYSFLGNLKVNASAKISLGTSINLSSSKQGSPDGALLTRIYTFRPDLPLLDAAGNYAYSPFSAFENPVALSNVNNTNTTNLLLASVFAEFKILQNLKLRSSLSINYNNGNFKSYYPKYTTTGGFNIVTGLGLGFGQQSSSKALSHLLEHTLTYNKIFAQKHNFNAVAGASWQGDDAEYLQASGKGFPNDGVLNNLSSASQNYTIASTKTQSGLISYFGRVNYQYNQKYLLTLSARTDESSKFAVENKWAFFPTAAIGWRLSEEKFLKNASFINDLKLRASTGVTGSQNFGAYQWLTLFQATSYGGSPAVIQNQLGNDKLRWELTRQTDIGIDFSLFNKRLNGTIDVYEKNTSDLLYFFIPPGTTGYTSVIGNLGNTQNRGIEFTINTDVISKNNFTWNIAFNTAFNRNKLIKLNDDYLNADGYIDPPNTGSLLKIGEPMGLMYGYIAEGIFETKEEIDALNAAAGGVYQATGTARGDLKFRDVNGDKKITTADQTIIGNANPDFAGGLTSNLQYKGLKLSLLFTYSVGNDIRWGTESSNITFSTSGSENKLLSVLNRWTPDNPTNQPRAVYLDPNINWRVSSYYVHDGSYVRLKNIYMSYDLPNKLIQKIQFIKAASFFASGTNLFTITKYPGANPETSNLYNDDVSAGLDNSRFPIAKVFTIGCKINF
jgi:TonB-dependent starch-binding outer membrane protein SusC